MRLPLGGLFVVFFVSNTAEFTLCALGAGSDASLAEMVYFYYYFSFLFSIFFYFIFLFISSFISSSSFLHGFLLTTSFYQTYTEALSNPNTQGTVLVAGTFTTDITNSAFNNLYSSGAVSLIDSSLPSQTDGTGQLRDTIFGPSSLTTSGDLLDSRNIPFDSWFFSPSTSTNDARVISTRRPPRLLLNNGGGFTAAPNCNLFIAKYIEGASWNKAIVIYNPSNSPAPLEFINLRKITNGETSWKDSTQIRARFWGSWGGRGLCDCQS